LSLGEFGGPRPGRVKGCKGTRYVCKWLASEWEKKWDAGSGLMMAKSEVAASEKES
jgi:hypothetical protein